MHGVKVTELPSRPLLEKDRLPAEPGIYFAVGSDGTVWYVGKAINLRDRWIGHHRYSQLLRINKKSKIRLHWYSCVQDNALLTKLERDFVETYHPVLNGSELQARQIIPSEELLRTSIERASALLFVLGFEQNNSEFGLPTIHLRYANLGMREFNTWVRRAPEPELKCKPITKLKKIFQSVNQRKGALRWSYYVRRKDYLGIEPRSVFFPAR